MFYICTTMTNPDEDLSTQIQYLDSRLASSVSTSAGVYNFRNTTTTTSASWSPVNGDLRYDVAGNIMYYMNGEWKYEPILTEEIESGIFSKLVLVP
jgi:hypothetical protein